MGSGLSGGVEEKFSYAVVIKAYFWLSSLEKLESSGSDKNCNDVSTLARTFDSLAEVAKASISECNLNIQMCRNPYVVCMKYKQMDLDAKVAFETCVLEAAKRRDHTQVKLATPQSQNYGLSFAGTALDTKLENDAASILRGNDNVTSNESYEEDSYLIPPLIKNEFEHLILRQDGKWCKYLGTAGCYLFIHILTKEVVSIRPEDYIDENEMNSINPNHKTSEEDRANGLPIIYTENLLTEIDKIVVERKKTPLLLDGTPDHNLHQFFKLKAVLEDVSSLVIPFAKSGVKRSEVVERCRITLISALKTGHIFALFLGEVGKDQADWKGKLCKKDVFPYDTFMNGGERLLQPANNPRYKTIFREEDLEYGQAVSRDGFKVVVISTLDPKEFAEKLDDSLPLGSLYPVFVLPSP